MPLTKNQLQMRKAGISASDVASILGLNPYRRPIDVWRDKTNPNVDEPQQENEQQTLGQIFEKYIADHYAKNLVPKGFKRRLYEPRTTLVHPKYDWVFATPDRFVFENEDLKELPRGLKDLAYEGDAQHLAEIKLVGPYAIKNWVTDSSDSEDGEDDASVEMADRVPQYVFCQCQWQMFVTNYKRVDVVAMLGGTKLRVFPLAYDAQFVSDAFAICNDFRQKYILTGIEPPPDGSSSYRTYLNDKYPGHMAAQFIPAPDHAAELVLDYDRLTTDAAEIKQKREQIAQTLKEIIGHNDGIQGDWGKVTWRLSKGRIDYKNLITALDVTPQTLDTYRKPGRSFRVTIKKAKS